jgi:hypothetical protein
MAAGTTVRQLAMMVHTHPTRRFHSSFDERIFPLKMFRCQELLQACELICVVSIPSVHACMRQEIQKFN